MILMDALSGSNASKTKLEAKGQTDKKDLKLRHPRRHELRDGPRNETGDNGLEYTSSANADNGIDCLESGPRSAF